MTPPSKPNENISKSSTKINENKYLLDLSTNPEYIRLLELYQDAEITKCRDLLENLEKQYPEHPDLMNFREDLHLKLSFMNMSASTEKEEKRKKRRSIRNLILFAIFSLLIVFVVFYFSYTYFNINVSAKQLESDAAVITSLENQLDQLLISGRPQPAAEILDRIKDINPEYENLQDLEKQVVDLLTLEENYQAALDLIVENRNSEALQILYEIESKLPGMWDVNQKISTIETSIQITEYLKNGDAAYQAERWDQVISAYENALNLDPGLNDPLMDQQLLRSYLNLIISMLNNEITTSEDIERAEDYYRKAVTMTSQSRAFASERENLQQASSDLLELKYSQVAKEVLADKNQSVTSVSKAVSFLRKAANIEPENKALNSDLENAEYYQIAFKNLISMNWEQVIRNINQIESGNSNYASGNANEMLFNAYYELGKQYSSVGLYLDAISNFEQAEILAWSDSDNLLKLFQIQIILGDTYGNLADYKNAVSYYQYALNAIQAYPRLQNSPSTATNFAQANFLANSGNFESAYEAFQEVLNNINGIFSESEIEIDDGVCLAFFASSNYSTVEAIRKANNLPMSMAITLGRKLTVPRVEK